jgi:hypothetical protein
VTVLAVIAGLELVLIGYLVLERRKANGDFIALVDRLCQRLQAPGAAVLEHDEAVARSARRSTPRRRSSPKTTRATG